MFLSAQLVFEESTEGLKACSVKKKELLITAMENKSVKKDVNKKKKSNREIIQVPFRKNPQ